MTLVQLRHFISLAQTGSFTQSAELLNVTQPALSRSIRLLEMELRQPLFDRVGKRNELTPFGVEILQVAKQMAAQADDIIARGRGAASGQTGKLSLGLGTSPATLLTLPILEMMTVHHARVHVEITRGQPEPLVAALRERQLDALIIDPRSLPAATDLVVSDVVYMRGAAMCRPGHPLTKLGGPIPFAALSSFVVAATPWSNEVVREIVSQYGAIANLNEFITLRCDDLRSLTDLARRSDVVVLAVRSAAHDLCELQLEPTLNTQACCGIVTLKGRSEPTTLRAVRQLICKILHD
jgi:DNA-binding transcriptional LysR family regulator